MHTHTHTHTHTIQKHKTITKKGTYTEQQTKSNSRLLHILSLVPPTRHLHPPPLASLINPSPSRSHLCRTEDPGVVLQRIAPHHPPHPNADSPKEESVPETMAGTCERWTHKIHYPCIGVCACVQRGRQCKNTLHNNKTTSILHVSRVHVLHMIHALSTSVYMVPVSLSLWMKNYTLFTIDVLYIRTYMLLPNTCLKEWIITLKLERKNLFLNIPAVFLQRGAVTHTHFLLSWSMHIHADAILPHLIYTCSMSATVSVHLIHNGNRGTPPALSV